MCRTGRYSGRRLLLSGVCAAALFALVEGEHLEAKAGELPKVWISLFGGYDQWEDGKPRGFWPNPLLDFELGDGFNVGGEVGARFPDDVHTLIARVRYMEMDDVDDAAANYVYKYYFANGVHEEHAFVGDLEIGRDVGLGTLGSDAVLRFHIGIRVAHFEAESNVDFLEGYYGYVTSGGSQNIDRKFTGAGPRAGFNLAVPLAQWATLDLTGAGSLLFGRHSFDLNGSGVALFTGPFAFSQNRSDFVVVPNVDATASLTFPISATMSMTFGYRIDAYFSVHDDGGPEHEHGNRIIHGPYGQITIKFPAGPP